MSNELPPTLRDITADRDWWLTDSGAHYRELAGWLREVATRCRLANPQKELLRLAKQYESRAKHLERRGSAEVTHLERRGSAEVTRFRSAPF
jgi:hypothetical protein